MRRSLASRIAAVAIAIMAAVSTPGLALLHGDAHHHMRELTEHHSAPGPDAAHNPHEATGSAYAVKMAADHAHPEVAGALSVRMDARVFTLPPIAVEILSGIGFARTASLPLTASPAGSGPGRASTRQPRAPPLS